MIFYLFISLLLADNSCGIDHCIECYYYDTCDVCEDGYVSNYYSCDECHKTCKKCASIEENYCTECYDGFYLQIYNSYYKAGYCKPCSEDGLCSKCESKSPYKCTECIKNYYLNKTTNKCIQCHQSCGTCSGPSEDQCSTCKEGYIQIDNLCKTCGDHCIECENAEKCKTCEEKYFLDGSQCKKCDDSCKTCHGEAPTDCDECINGYYHSSNGLCRQCDPNCDNCVDDRSHCTSCKDGKYLDEESHTCQNCDEKCKTCKNPNKCDTCADGYARETDQDDCKKCDSKCGTCAYFLDYYYYELFCTTCAASYYPQKVSYYEGAVNCYPSGVEGCLIATGYGECQTCKQGWFKDGYECTKCDDSCLTCEKKNSCTACKQGFYLNKETSLCTKCSDNCVDCKSGNNCTMCEDKYFVSSNGSCEHCHESCESCNDDTNACIECAKGYFKNEFKRCLKCTDNCDECTNATHCNDCASEFFIAPDGSCSPCAEVCYECTGPTAEDCLECDPGYYISKSLKKCFKCNEACSVCSGPNDYECTKCSPGYFLNKDVDVSPGKTADKCTKCENGCKTCSSPTKCSDCLDGFYFKNENCEHCSAGCKKCSEGVKKCTECFNGYYISSTDGKYVNCSRCPTGCDSCSKDESGKLICDTCFEGYYKHDKRCLQCISPCSSCTSETECTSCIKGHLLEGTSCSSQCSSECSTCSNSADSCTDCNDGYILNGTVCLQCPVDCKTCEIEADASLCTSCFEGFYLHNGKCNKCYYECATCFDNSKFCYTCKEGYYKYTQNEYYYGYCQECYYGTDHCVKCTSDFPEGDVVFTCLECEDDYFLKDNKCETCHSSCKTCDGTTENDCLSCHDEFFLVDGKCVECSKSCLTCSTSPTTCASCRSHQYLNNGQCFDCSNSCVECTDLETCTKCPEPKFLHDGKCIDSCREIGEDWGNNDNHECIKCNLENCNKYDQSCKCTSCNEGYHHVFYSVTSVEACLPCKLDNCKTCNGPKSNDCTECKQGFELQTNQGVKVCHKLCDDGYFVNESKLCEECHSPCKICSGVDGSICHECEEGYYLENNVCRFFPADSVDNKHCENENKGDKPVQITIEITKFESFNNEQSGGALRIVNCGVTGENIKFNDCTSQKGGGGAIYIFNNKEIDQPISFNKMTFTSCKAAYGGAIYIYSKSESPISINSCTFTNNDVYSPKPSFDNKLFGGSAIYLTVKNGAVNGCSFVKKTKLTTGMIKVTENFDLQPEGLLMLNSKADGRLNSVDIIKCSFEIEDNSNSNSSLVYIVEKQNSHYVHISEDKKTELNRRFVEFDLANSKIANNKKELVVKMSSSTNILLAISSFMLFTVVATFVISKRGQLHHEMTNDSIDFINA